MTTKTKPAPKTRDLTDAEMLDAIYAKLAAMEERIDALDDKLDAIQGTVALLD